MVMEEASRMKRIELELVDVLTSDAGLRGPAQALLRAHRGTRVVLVPLGVAEAAQLACLIDGHGIERASWQTLYLSSLAAGGLRVIDVQIERARPDTAFSANVQLGRLGSTAETSEPALMSLGAPVDAALLIALEAGAAVYAHPSCFRNTPARPRAATMAASDEAPPAAGKKEPLAALLANLPDEDFGNVH
jgi:hypothetical protein